MLAGAASGIVTATLNVRFKILHLLASILTMIALFSVNLRVMGRPNVAILIQDTVLTPFYGLGQHWGCRTPWSGRCSSWSWCLSWWRCWRVS